MGQPRHRGYFGRLTRTWTEPFVLHSVTTPPSTPSASSSLPLFSIAWSRVPFSTLLMLRAVSIRQPWTELILRGRKTIEVRSCATMYRGDLWLHAGLRLDPSAPAVSGACGHELVRGAIVGHCELVDCVPFDHATWQDWRDRHLVERRFTRPCYAWLLRSPVRCDPIPFVGRLGLMRVPTLSLGRP